MKRLIKIVKEHKITSIVVLLALAAVLFFVFQISQSKSESISYEVEKVESGSIETIISASGQVGDVDMTEITSNVSGEVKVVMASEGQEVKNGDTILEIDSEDLENDIYQAQLAVEAAQLNLQKLKDPDEVSVEKAENGLRTARYDLAELELKQEHELEQAQEDEQNAKDNIENLDEDSPDYDTKLQTYKSQLSEVQRKIETYNQNHPIETAKAENNIREKEKVLDEIRNGPTDTEISLQENTIKEKQSRLASLESQREDYTVKAPIDGIIAELNISEGENISGGGGTSSGNSSDAGATNSNSDIIIISKNKNAEVSVNEIDMPDIKEGQDVILTFDALEDLEINGKISNISKISTADQGVVYNDVTISFDSQDERIINGMSVSADIITDFKDDILTVPGSAVKSQIDGDYVEVVMDKNEYIESISTVENVRTRMEKVETGITDDVDVEIISGLDEGDIIVLKTIENIDSSETSSEANNNSIIPMGPGGRSGK